MKFLNKKGGAEESPLTWLIGAILGIVLMVIIGTIAIQYYIAWAQAGDSFDKLIENLTELKNGDSGHMLYQLPSSYALVGFSGKNFGKGFMSGGWRCPQDSVLDTWIFTWELEKPEVCGDGACLCTCPRSFFESVLPPGACSNMGSFCKNIKVDYDVEILDPECPFGTFMPGPSGGVYDLNYERDGETIYLCPEEGCADKVTQSKNDFELLANAMEVIEDNKTVQIDYSLPSEYALVGFDDDSDFGDYAWTCNDWLFTWPIKKPAECGDKPCVCSCRKRGITDGVLWGDSCSYESSYCEILDIEDYEIQLNDPSCAWGLFQPSSGNMTAYITRQGNNVTVCSDESCAPKTELSIVVDPSSVEDDPFNSN